ncbi:MAG: hypothetical protein ACI4RL_00975 [Ruminococcus sp.]
MNNKNQEQFISKENKKRILLCVNALLMVVLIIIATYAWFSRTTVDDIKVNEVAFQGSSDLEVSLDDTNYAFSQTLTFNSDSLAQDITGDGLPGTFSHPSTSASEDNATLLVPKSDTSGWDTEVSGEDVAGKSSDYKIQKIYFRSKEPMTVYLGDGSEVLGATEISGKKLVGNSEEVGNKSTIKGVTNGTDSVSVSKDCIVGASRFAFLNAGKTDVQCIWIPRPNIFYETKKDASDNVVKTIHGGTSSDLNTTFNVSDSGQAYPDSTVHYYYTTDNSSVKQTSSKAIAGREDLSTTSYGNSKSKLVELTKASESDTYYKGSIYVVIWVEGCDAEARQAFGGGKFGALMRFVGVSSST